MRIVAVALSSCLLAQSVPVYRWGKPIGSALAMDGLALDPADCGAAPKPDEPVPELLALADWPLDKVSSAGCAAPVAALEALPAPVEIHVPRVRKVYAEGYDGTRDDAGAAPGGTPGKKLRQLAALDAVALDRMRGGFEVPNTNLRLSFSFERVVYINGELIATTVLNLKDLQQASGGGAGQPAMSAGMADGTAVIQNGAGNGFSVQAGQNAAGTIIQNTLNNQQISTITTISAAANSAQVLRAINMQSAIRDSVINSLRH